MRFSQFALLSGITASFALGQGIDLNQLANSDQNDIVIDEKAPSTMPSIELDITYNIEDRNQTSNDQPISFDQDETIMLNYTVTNNEPCDMSVVGVSGNILSYPNGELVTQISLGEMDNLYAFPNKTLNFRQEVVIDLQPGLYYLFPIVHVTNETALAIVDLDSTRADDDDIDIETKSVAANPTVFSVEEPLMSIFNPQFLSIQLMVIFIVGAASYFYLNKNNNNNNKKTKQPLKQGKVDPTEWLPEQYKK
ncbi:increased recombination centers protein 22 [Monosporozyma servazzii]